MGNLKFFKIHFIRMNVKFSKSIRMNVSIWTLYIYFFLKILTALLRYYYIQNYTCAMCTVWWVWMWFFFQVKKTCFEEHKFRIFNVSLFRSSVMMKNLDTFKDYVPLKMMPYLTRHSFQPRCFTVFLRLNKRNLSSVLT